jgi:hypothetical protein
MPHFHVCPECNTTHADEEQMQAVYEIHELFGGDMTKVMAEVQNLEDADREQLRLLTKYKEDFKKSLHLIREMYRHTLDALEDDNWEKL